MTAINSNRAIRGPVTAVPVVAGKGVRLVADTENNRWVVEADETVLWSNSSGSSSIDLSEALTNFEYCRFKMKSDQGTHYDFCNNAVGNVIVLSFVHGDSNAWTTWLVIDYNTSTNTLTVRHSKSLGHSFTSTTTTLSGLLDSYKDAIIEVVGVNRIAGN